MSGTSGVVCRLTPLNESLHNHFHLYQMVQHQRQQTAVLHSCVE